MVLAAWIGLMFSIPFVFADGSSRVTAAALPLFAIPPAAAVAMISNRRVTSWGRSSSLPTVLGVLPRRVSSRRRASGRSSCWSPVRRLRLHSTIHRLYLRSPARTAKYQLWGKLVVVRRT